MVKIEQRRDGGYKVCGENEKEFDIWFHQSEEKSPRGGKVTIWHMGEVEAGFSFDISQKFGGG